MATLCTKAKNTWERLYCPHSPNYLASLQKLFVYSWIRILCICAEETKRSPEKGSDFLHSTKTSQGLLIHKVGIIGQVTEQGEGGWSQRETYKCSVSLHSSSAISQLPNGKYWFILRSLKGFFFVLFFDLLESQAYDPMTTLAKTTQLDSTHSNENKPSRINCCLFIYVTVSPVSPLEWQTNCHHVPTYTYFSLSNYYKIHDF